MSWWGWGIVYAAAVGLQLTLSSFFGLYQPAPDVFLAVTVTVALLKGPVFGAGWGLLLGLSGDLISGRLIGLGALSLAIPGIIAGLLARRVFRENLLVLSAMAMLLGYISSLIYALGASVMGVRFDISRALLVIGVPVGLYGAVLVPLFYALAHKRLGPGAGN
jgi:rod shape-determining protein MreD